MSGARLTYPGAGGDERLTDCPSCGLAVAVELHGRSLLVRCPEGCATEQLAEALDVTTIAAELAGEGLMELPFGPDPPPEAGLIDLPPEALAAVESAREERASRNGGNAPPCGRRVVLTAASEITPEALRWLWDRRLPLRGLSLIAGEPGLGKSTLTAELAADVTRGRLDGDLRGEPRDVLIATAEDHFASVVWGRLTAAGADMARVHRVHVEDRDGEELLTLPDDVTEVERRCAELAVDGRPVALVAVDPITAFIGGSVDSHRDAAVRRVLAPLAGLAECQQLAAVGIAHLNKDTAAKLLARVGGSVAFGAAPRSVLAFARHPDDPDGERGNGRVIVHAKSNHGAFAPSLAARIETRVVETVGEVSRLVIDGECEVSPDDLQRGREDAGQDCEESIASVLADGPCPSREAKGRVAAELGCSRQTVERAAKRLTERGELTIESGGFPRRTTWELAVASRADAATEATAREATEQTRIPKAKTPSSDSQSPHAPGAEATGPEAPLATPSEEGELERVREKFSDAEPFVSGAAEARRAAAERGRLADALPASPCSCAGPLLASDGSCVRCGREAP